MSGFLPGRKALLASLLFAGGCRGEESPSVRLSVEAPVSQTAEVQPSAPKVLDSKVRLINDDAPVFLIFKNTLYLGARSRLELRADAQTESLRLIMAPTSFDALGLVAFDLNLPEQDRLQIADKNWQVLSAEPSQVSIGEDPTRVLTGVKLELVSRLGASKIAVTASLFVGALGAEQFFDSYRERREAAMESWTPEAFTAWVCEALNGEFPGREYRVKESLSIARNAASGTLGLGNFFANFSYSPTKTHRMAELGRIFVLESSSLAPDIEGASVGDLLASVKSADYIENIQALEDPENGHLFVHEPLVHDLSVVYVVDRPDTMVNLTAEILAGLPLDRADLLGVVAKNLWANSETIRVHGDPTEGPIMITCGGNYEASLLLVPKLWDALSPMLSGDPVVAVPARAMLLVCGGDDEVGVATLRERVAGASQLPYPISGELFTRRDGRWHLLQEDFGTPIGEA